MKLLKTLAIAVIAIVSYVGLNSDLSPINQAKAAGGQIMQRNQVAPNRYVYYPGTEVLAEDEIRLIACGTGMPGARRSQAATCFLIELGNGDKFLFDIGTGSTANLSGLMIPYAWLDKVFLTHLHTDHWGDFDALWAGGWTAGRFNEIEVWGPSGMDETMGTKYAMKHFLETYKWDKVTRSSKISPISGELIVHEFDYKIPNQVVYEKNGVVVRTIPAIHAGDGPVSYILEYAGMKVVIGGDTGPNKWMIEHAKDADLLIHEAFMTPQVMKEMYNLPPNAVMMVSTQLHTSPQAFGKIMSTLKPRHAVAYHFFNDENVRYGVYDGIRETYNGPLSMADDLMVWNITKDKIVERMAVITDDSWGVTTLSIPGKPDKSIKPMSDFIKSGRWQPAYDAQNPMMDRFIKKHNIKPEDDWRTEQKEAKE